MTIYQSRNRRRGIATVELAVCVPMIVTITFGAIEAANFIHLKQSLTESAYEAARIATTTGATAETAEQRFREIMTARNIQNAEIVLSPKVTEKTSSGTVVSATVTAPADNNSICPFFYFKSSRLTSQIVMVRL